MADNSTVELQQREVSSNLMNTEYVQPSEDSEESDHAVHPALEQISNAARYTKCRNLTGYWLLGLCNNYAYVIMLSAAHDILNSDFNQGGNETNVTTVANNSRDCNKVSTGAILLADILPSLFIKIIAPFVGIGTSIRMFFVVTLCGASFLCVALSRARWLAFLGVVFASLSSGLGETTLLSYASFFDRNVVSTWSSGTGGSGIFGALSYAAMTTAGLSSRNTLLIMMVIPVIMALSYYVLLIHPFSSTSSANGCKNREEMRSLIPCATSASVSITRTPQPFWTSVRSKMHLIKPLLKFAVPLMLVYLAEYFINQGLLELIYFKGIWLSHKEQYRWFQVDYQLGVFISRSSVNFFTISKLWILPILQFVNVAVFLIEVSHPFLPYIWLVFAFVLFEGLLGGAAYVNTYYTMTKEVPPEDLEFSMAIVPLADTLGVALAGAVALPVHDYFCSRPLST